MGSADTRARLLDAAWEVSAETGIAGLTLGAVGERAGVSRQAVYLHFGNRATLLVEMARRVDETSGFLRRLAAARALAPRDAFRRMLEEWFEYLPRIAAIARALEAAVVNGSDGAEAYFDRMGDLRSALRRAVARLHAEGLLSPRWDVERAADWAWSAAHPATFHHLVGERGWAPAAVAARTIAALERELLA